MCVEVLFNELVDVDVVLCVDLIYLRVYVIDDVEMVEVDDVVSVEALGDDG